MLYAKPERLLLQWIIAIAQPLFRGWGPPLRGGIGIWLARVLRALGARQHIIGLNISMMTSSNGNIFRVSRWIPRTKASDGALMFSLICVWINAWVNNREACDLRRYHAHYDVIVISLETWIDICRNSGLRTVITHPWPNLGLAKPPLKLG